MRNICNALFHVLDYLDKYKAIKENLLREVGHLDPIRTPTHLRLSRKPKFVVFFLEAFPKGPYWTIQDYTRPSGQYKTNPDHDKP